jgi:hypothetical protein
MGAEVREQRSFQAAAVEVIPAPPYSPTKMLLVDRSLRQRMGMAFGRLDTIIARTKAPL